MAAPLHDEPCAALEQRGRRIREQVEALLRVEPPDHPDHRPVVVRIEPDPRQQVRSARRLAAPILTRVRRRLVGVGRWIPDLRVEPVQDPEEAVAFRPQRTIEPHPELRVSVPPRRTRARPC